jgi:hypothetical protein
MATCSNCGRNVAYDAVFCPGCGKQKPGEGSGCGGLILLIIIIWFILGSNNKESNSTNSTSVTSDKTQSKWEIER